MYNLSSLCVQYVGNAINLSSFCFSTWATRSTCYLFVSARGQHVQHAMFLFQHVGNMFNMLSFCFSTWATCSTINMLSFCFSTWATHSTCYLFVSARGQRVQPERSGAALAGAPRGSAGVPGWTRALTPLPLDAEPIR